MKDARTLRRRLPDAWRSGVVIARPLTDHSRVVSLAVQGPLLEADRFESMESVAIGFFWTTSMPHLVVKRTVLVAMTIAYAACRADLPATRLTNKEATAALRAEIEMVAEEQGRVALGTCKPALNPRYKDQVACTLLVISQAGTSETQADFHWDGQKWVSTPSESQDILPFPDPLLADIHSWTKNIDQLEPHFLKN